MRAGDLVPDNWQIQSALGIAYDLTGDHDKAIAAYQRALSSQPGGASVLNNLALSQASAGDIDGGIGLLRRADQQPDSNAQIRQNLALLLAIKGRIADAERLVRADLPKEMADANIVILRRLARQGVAPSVSDLAELTTVQSIPKSEPVEIAAVAAPEAAPAPAGEAPEDLAAAASAAADDAFATLMSGAAAEPEDTATASQSPVYRVQLASVGTEAEALSERDRLTTRHPTLLGSGSIEIRHVQLGSGAKVWRVYAGPFPDKVAASALCDALAVQSAACLVTVGDANP